MTFILTYCFYLFDCSLWCSLMFDKIYFSASALPTSLTQLFAWDGLMRIFRFSKKFDRYCEILFSDCSCHLLLFILLRLLTIRTVPFFLYPSDYYDEWLREWLFFLLLRIFWLIWWSALAFFYLMRTSRLFSFFLLLFLLAGWHLLFSIDFFYQPYQLSIRSCSCSLLLFLN